MTAKLSFRKWLEFETHKKKTLEATESGEFPEMVFALLSVASVSVNKKEKWQNTVFSLLTSIKDFQPDQNLPIIKDAPAGEGRTPDWEYEGRSWAYWSHLLANAYGWTLEYIADLDVNEALARVQEILTDEHLEREFYYSLSEIAYPYNKSTKKNHFKPMPRPYWMKPTFQPLKKMKFLKEWMPVGLIQDTSGMPLEYNPLRDYVEVPKKKTEETQPPANP